MWARNRPGIIRVEDEEIDEMRYQQSDQYLKCTGNVALQRLEMLNFISIILSMLATRRTEAAACSSHVASG